MKPWTPEDDARLAELYPRLGERETAARMGRTTASISNRARKLGIRRPKNAGRFQPGRLPWNAGKKGWKSGGASEKTRFKKGNRSGKAATLWQPVGSERITKEGYVQVKVNDDFPIHRRWVGKHVLIWERLHGPVPTGYVVVFKDGDKRNLVPENLECISRKDAMLRNSVHNLPLPIKAAVDAKRALMRKITLITRKQQHHEQTHDQ